MDLADFERVADAFGAFHAHFAPLFGRKDTQVRGDQYLRGLLVQQTDRRNAKKWPRQSGEFCSTPVPSPLSPSRRHAHALHGRLVHTAGNTLVLCGHEGRSSYDEPKRRLMTA